MNTIITTFILDDEPDSIEVLTYHLNRIPGIKIIGSQSNPEMAIEEVKQLSPQLLFLDIQMPQLNGFEFLEQITDRRFKVIFLTAFDEYAIKAFRFNATDYLLKPVSFSDLENAILKVFSQNDQGNELEKLLQSVKYLHTKKPKISVPSLEGIEFIPIEEIIHCEADNNYTLLYLSNQRKIMASKTLKEFELLLENENFFRVHHSHLVNLDHLLRYIKADGGSILLSNQSIIPVSRTKKEELLKKIGL
jgi:two-component system, LytTR family, response regulator